jgi:hypothetical protein
MEATCLSYGHEIAIKEFSVKWKKSPKLLCRLVTYISTAKAPPLRCSSGLIEIWPPGAVTAVFKDRNNTR